MRKYREKIQAFGMILMTAAVLTGCGASPGAAKYSADTGYPTDNIYRNESALYEFDEAGEAAEEMDMAAEKPMEAPSSTVNQQEVVDIERKLIKTVQMDVETEEYDVLFPKVEEQIAKLGGYIESLTENQNRYGYDKKLRYASITARIPQDKLDAFVTEVAKESNVTSRNESVEDVTLRYVDLESHKKVLLTEQERLLALLENAENMEDIITIESRLSEVRYQLESMESQLRTFDNKINYSTVYLYINEVERLTPPIEETAWDKIRTGFGESVYNVLQGAKNAGIALIINIPYLLVWAVVIIIILVIAKIIIKIGAKKREKKQQKQQSRMVNVQVPNMQMPNMQMPNIQTPNMPTPNAQTSNVQMPNMPPAGDKNTDRSEHGQQ